MTSWNSNLEKKAAKVDDPLANHAKPDTARHQQSPTLRNMSTTRSCPSAFPTTFELSVKVVVACLINTDTSLHFVPP